MLYKARAILLLICLTVLLSASFVAAQDKGIDLKPNQSLTFSLAPNDEKSFTLKMKQFDFAEFSWLANDTVSFSILLTNPRDEDFIEQVGFEQDSVAFVASEDGEYTINFKISNASEVKEPQKVTLEYKNVFKLPARSAVSSFRKINGFDVKIVKTPQTKYQNAKSIALFEKNGRLQKIIKSDGGDIGGFYFADDISRAYSAIDKKSINLIKITPDKTGDGTPDVMIKHYSGGAHCCSTALFFELGESIKAIKPIFTGNSEIIASGKNPRGGLRFETGDDTFAYWLTAFAFSPIPSVVLEFKKGAFRPNFDLMKKPAPSLTYLKNKAYQEASLLGKERYGGFEETGDLYTDYEKFDGEAGVFWGTMLDLIYTGHEDLAWQYLDLVWSPQKQGKEIFVEDFKNQLAQSRYWQMIEEDRKTK
jgi:hypothetical protein